MKRIILVLAAMLTLSGCLFGGHTNWKKAGCYESDGSVGANGCTWYAAESDAEIIACDDLLEVWDSKIFGRELDTVEKFVACGGMTQPPNNERYRAWTNYP